MGVPLGGYQWANAEVRPASCSGSEAGSYSRRMDFCITQHSRVIKKRRVPVGKCGGESSVVARRDSVRSCTCLG